MLMLSKIWQTMQRCEFAFRVDYGHGTVVTARLPACFRRVSAFPDVDSRCLLEERAHGSVAFMARDSSAILLSSRTQVSR